MIPTCGTHIGGVSTDKTAYLDDTDEIAEMPKDLQVVANKVLKATSFFGMIIKTSKTKTMSCSWKRQDTIKSELEPNGESPVGRKDPLSWQSYYQLQEPHQRLKRWPTPKSSCFKAFIPI